MNRLFRYPKQGYIGGVCHGLGVHTKIDPIIWRILAVFGGFCLIYLILWIVVHKAEEE
jgi:phage shock protein PspC (stress-responsive transcriptional regulator)